MKSLSFSLVWFVLLAGCVAPTPVATPIPTFTVTSTSVPPTPAPTTTPTELSSSTLLEKSDYQEVTDPEDHLMKEFPGSKVYRNGSDVVVINKELGLNLVGQTIMGDTGISLTLLYTPEIYQLNLRKNLSTSVRKESLGQYADLIGYKPGGERIGGYLDLSGYQNIRGMINTVAILSDLNNHSVEPGVDLERYQPQPDQIFVIVFSTTGEKNSIANSLPEDSRKKMAGSFAYRITNGKRLYWSNMIDISSNKTMIIATDFLAETSPEWLSSITKDDLNTYFPTQLALLSINEPLLWLAKEVADNTDYQAYDPIYRNGGIWREYGRELNILFERLGLTTGDFTVPGLDIKEVNVISF
jgi:hypothetical protein